MRHRGCKSHSTNQNHSAKSPIQEGRYGADSTIEAFTIGLRVAGRWETVHIGNGIGNTFSLVLEETHTADAVRIEFGRWQRKINVNMVNAY